LDFIFEVLIGFGKTLCICTQGHGNAQNTIVTNRGGYDYFFTIGPLSIKILTDHPFSQPGSHENGIGCDASLTWSDLSSWSNKSIPRFSLQEFLIQNGLRILVKLE
jgi:hypothetical protein